MKNKKAFSLVEVSLYLALSALLAAGIIFATYTNINRQRYNNAVQGFVDFLQSQYASVINVKNQADGRSDTAIYGKLVTFGERATEDKTTVYAYDVTGDVIEANGDIIKRDGSIITAHNGISQYGSTLELLGSGLLDTNVFKIETDKFGVTNVEYTNMDEFELDWNAKIQNSTMGEYYTGALLIVRSPISGNVTTYVARDWDSDTSEFWVRGAGNTLVPPTNIKEVNNPDLANKYLTNLINGGEGVRREVFKMEDVDFCVFSEDYNYAGNVRADIRIVSNASSASGIIQIASDGEDSKCKER